MLALVDHLIAPQRLDVAGDHGGLQLPAGFLRCCRQRHDSLDRHDHEIAANLEMRVHAERRADEIPALLPPVIADRIGLVPVKTIASP